MIEIGFKSDKGLKRKKNEDAFFVAPGQNLFVIADGVGGNNAGEIASKTAVNSVAEYLRNNPIEANCTESSLRNYFLACLDQVNKIIYELSRRHSANAGMATTILIAYLAGNHVYIVNVGDSRAYLHRAGSFTQITEDHTYVNKLIKEGKITKEQARFHEKKNIITQAIGGDITVRPDFFRVELMQSDILLLCTDGLYGEVSDHILCDIVSKGKPMHALSADLIQKANQCGGRDNITVICLKI